MADEIYAVAAVFAAPAEESGAQNALMAMCGAAERELLARLRTGITAESCRESFICAAALLAASAFCAGGAAQGVRSFTVGSVSVATGAENRKAEDMRVQAALLMRPFCRSDFSFAGVRG